jgi:iron(III) transport system ATP-binding protein
MLELQNISKAYGDRTVLSDISLSIEKGEIVSILGPSGCGKTTLLNLVLGLVTATDGRILFDGVDLTHVPMEKRGFNIVFQDYALFPNLNAYENIVYGLRNRPDVSTRSEVDDLIDLLGLRRHLEQRIDELSGGQKQRVALARTLVKSAAWRCAACCCRIPTSFCSTNRFPLWTASSRNRSRTASSRSPVSSSSRPSS